MWLQRKDEIFYERHKEKSNSVRRVVYAKINAVIKVSELDKREELLHLTCKRHI